MVEGLEISYRPKQNEFSTIVDRMSSGTGFVQYTMSRLKAWFMDCRERRVLSVEIRKPGRCQVRVLSGRDIMNGICDNLNNRKKVDYRNGENKDIS